MRHLRSLAIAAVVLMISAAVVFAGGGPAWKTVTPEAKASPSPSSVPVVVPSASPSSAPVVVPSAPPAPDPSASPVAAAAEAESEEAENHGKVVSEAAHSGLPAGTEDEYRNHGEYVSSVARDNHGQSKKTDPTATGGAKASQPDDDEDDD
jgi:hypothetical protein